MPFTQQELVAMYAEAVSNKSDVLEIKRLGGDPAELMNRIFDAHVVFGMWRQKRGGIGYMAVKGMDHLRRIVEQDQAEKLRLATFDFGTSALSQAVAKIYCAVPDARWMEGYSDGKVVGLWLAKD